MNPFDTVLASATRTHLTLGGLFGWLQATGRLGPLVREALAARLVQEHARQAGLSVTAEELQTAADGFRRRQRLNSAADTQAWMAAHGLTVQAFEDGLEQEVLAAKLCEHVTGSYVSTHFETNQAGYERLALALILAPREDLAREAATQIRDEDRGPTDIARELGLQLERADVLRKDLQLPLGSALTTAQIGNWVGPVKLPGGFALAAIENCQPANLDGVTRQRIQNELFGTWLAAQMQSATLNLALAGVS